MSYSYTCIFIIILMWSYNSVWYSHWSISHDMPVCVKYVLRRRDHVQCYGYFVNLSYWLVANVLQGKGKLGAGKNEWHESAWIIMNKYILSMPYDKERDFQYNIFLTDLLKRRTDNNSLPGIMLTKCHDVMWSTRQRWINSLLKMGQKTACMNLHKEFIHMDDIRLQLR